MDDYERRVRRIVFNALDAAVARGNNMGTEKTATEVGAILRFTDAEIERLPATQVDEAVAVWQEGMEAAGV